MSDQWGDFQCTHSIPNWRAVLSSAEQYYKLELKANTSFHLGECSLEARSFSREMMRVFHKVRRCRLT